MSSHSGAADDGAAAPGTARGDSAYGDSAHGAPRDGAPPRSPAPPEPSAPPESSPPGSSTPPGSLAATAPQNLPDGPPGVVVGVDGSDGSLWALDRAFAEAAAHRLPLYVVAAVNPAPGGYIPGMADLVQGSVDRLLQGMTDVAQQAVETVAARHPDPPYTEVHVLLGDPVAILLTASKRHHTLVVGTRGNGGFSRLLLGSVASAVAHHAGCAVLLAPPEPRNIQPGSPVP